MKNNSSNNNKFNFSWGSGSSDLFLQISGGKPEVLDVEFDGEELHRLCGGRTYYVSRSGCSGAGYLNSLGSLIPLGSYRVDTAHNEFQWFLPVGKIRQGWEEQDVLVAVPYVSHENDKSETLRSYPTVIKIGPKVVYCDFGANFLEVLSLLLAGKDLPEECVINGVTYGCHGHRTLKRAFTRLNSWGEPIQEEVVLEHYNLCSMDNTPNPWEFFSEELKYYRASWGERLFQLLSVEKLEDGTFVRTVKVDGQRYRGEILPGNPLETGELTAGWQCLADGVLVRFYDRSNETHLVAYAKTDETYGKLARRLANRMGEDEEFISFVSDHEEDEWIEYEVVVPKVLYLLDPATQVAEARKGLARKVREDVMRHARQWVDQVNDQSLLEVIPDDTVVTFDDSLTAGNCRPGTEAFVAQYFPGQTCTTAGELKKYADNYNVMRIFRYLATTGRFSWKAKTLE